MFFGENEENQSRKRKKYVYAEKRLKNMFCVIKMAFQLLVTVTGKMIDVNLLQFSNPPPSIFTFSF